jgi:hypothetical protein
MKQFTVFFASILFAFMANAQVQFSGTYEIDRSKSQLNEEFSMAPNKVIIMASKKDFQIERFSSFQGNSFTMTDKYTLDGKECINKGFMDSTKKSVAVWNKKGKKLTVTSKIPMQDGGEVSITEVYTKEGDNLVLDSKASSSYGDMNEKMVFVKK